MSQPRLIALVGIAADCNFISSFNSSSSAREWLLSMVNSASEVYERQLNITLGISALVLVNETNCTTTLVIHLLRLGVILAILTPLVQ